MSKLKEILNTIRDFGIASLILGTIALLFVDADKERLYNKAVLPMCQKTIRKFDENNNSVLEFQEGVKLTRAIGYDKLIQQNPIIFELNPDYHINKKLIQLRLKSDVGTYTGLSFHRHLVPLFDERFYFPVSKLEELSEESLEKNMKKIVEDEQKEYLKHWEDSRVK